MHAFVLHATVNLQYQYNYVSAFRKAALLFVTHSRGTGWHHVEVHSDEWWVKRFEMYGFRYDAKLTEACKKVAKEGRWKYMSPKEGKPYDGFYIFSALQVFVNPMVAASFVLRSAHQAKICPWSRVHHA